MMRSMWSGVAGLKTHQLEMDVIGNNIANVNTTSYKSQATGFQDILYQTVKSGTGAGNNLGSTNTSQVGLGSKVGSIYTNIAAQGSAITTNNVYDLMITGDSFFVTGYGDGNNNFNGKGSFVVPGEKTFTRDGSFMLDEWGYLVTKGTGQYVLCAENDEAITDNLKALQVMKVVMKDVNGDGIEEQVVDDTVPGEATGEAYMKGNINRDDKLLVDGKTIALSIFGEDGNTYTLKFTIDDDGDGVDNTYGLKLDRILDSQGNLIRNDYEDEKLTLSYSRSDGTLKSITAYGQYSFDKNGETVDESGSVTSTSFKYSQKIRTGEFERIVKGTDGKDYLMSFSVSRSSADNSDYVFSLDKVSMSDDTTVAIWDIENKKAELDYNETSGVLQMVDGVPGTSFSFSFDDYSDINVGPISFDFSESTKFISTDTSYTFNFDGEAAGKLGKSLYVDFSHTTNYASSNGGSSSSIYAYKGNDQGLNQGYASGTLTNVSFGTDGSIYGRYSNGQTIKKGQIAVAEFANAMGLEKRGENLYVASLNSGNPKFMDITEDGGYMNSGYLEGSNVDLAKEFTDMITTQRGFQANSKVITTSDEMLQILRGLKS